MSVESKYKRVVKLNNFREKLQQNKVCKSLINSLYPMDFTCNNCGRELPVATRSGLCKECDSKLEYNNGQICVTCGVKTNSETNYCLSCQNNKRYFQFARSPLIYTGTTRKLIKNFKFAGKRYLSTYFVNLMVDTYLDNPFTCDTVCEVPISKSRMVERGFNQSELLAKDIAKRLKLNHCSALEKVKDTVDQVGLSSLERKKNLEGAFACIKDVKGKNILLVDDVLTTGSTASECSKILLKAGAKSVEVLTIASVEEKIYLA